MRLADVVALHVGQKTSVFKSAKSAAKHEAASLSLVSSAGDSIDVAFGSSVLRDAWFTALGNVLMIESRK